MKSIFLWILVSVTVSFSSSRFVLDVELRTNFADNGSSTQLLTGYTYDASGNRVQSRVWSGSDSAVTPMSIVKFTNNTNGAVTEALQLSGTDTLAIVRYVYNNGNLIAVRTFRKDGTVRFTDSLIYDGLGRNIEEQRISSSGVKSYFHRYTLNAHGKIADTMFELVSTSYIASQATLFTYNPDSTVATETQWRLTGGSWYCISTKFMKYTAGSLVSVATHDRDGIGTAMTDSLVYMYDANGNRTKEEDFDGTKALTHRITYTWRDTQPSFVLMNNKTYSDQRYALSSKQGRLTADISSQNRGMVFIYDLSGKQVCRITVDRSGILPLNGIIGKGSYIAVLSIGGVKKQVMNFTKYN